MTPVRSFEWRELVYCECCNPARRLERACAGAVMRGATREVAICAECIRALQSMGYTGMHQPVCACGEPLSSRHALRRRMTDALELHLRDRSAVAAYEMLHAATLLEQCEGCASKNIEATALELARGLLEQNGGKHDA